MNQIWALQVKNEDMSVFNKVEICFESTVCCGFLVRVFPYPLFLLLFKPKSIIKAVIQLLKENEIRFEKSANSTDSERIVLGRHNTAK